MNRLRGIATRPTGPVRINQWSQQARNLVAWWPLNDIQTGRAFEVVHGFHGAFSGGPIWTPYGAQGIGPALNFDGTDDEVQVGSKEPLRITGDLTISCWAFIKNVTYSADNTGDTFIGYGAGGETEDTNIIYWLNMKEVDANFANLVYGHESGGGNNDEVVCTVGLQKIRWHHLLVRRHTGSNTISFILDGQLVQSTTYTTDPSGGTSGTFQLGCIVPTSSHCNIVLADMRIYDYCMPTPVARSMYDLRTRWELYRPIASTAMGKRGAVSETLSPASTLSFIGSLVKKPAIPQAGSMDTASALTASSPRTRFYFPATGTSAAAPAFDGGWNYTTEASRVKMNHVKGATPMTDGTQIGAWANTAGTKALDRQYISAPLDGAQNVGGTIKGQLLVREFANNDNVDQLILVVKVVSTDGGTVRGTVASINSYGGTAELRAPGYRNKFLFDGDAGAVVAAQNGDRIVVEIGYSNSAAGTTPEAMARWGEDASDLPENETQTTDGAGWIEFANTLTFQADAAGSISVGGSMATSSNLIRQPQKPIGGTLATSATDANMQTRFQSLSGTLTSSGVTSPLDVTLQSVGATLTTSADLSTDIVEGVSLSAGLTPTGSLARMQGKNLSAGLSFSASLTRYVMHGLDSLLDFAGTTTPLHLLNVTAAGALTLAASLFRQPQKLFTAALSFAASMGRTFGIMLASTLGLAGGFRTGCPLSVRELKTRIYERLEEDIMAPVHYTSTEVLQAINVAQRQWVLLTHCYEKNGQLLWTAGQYAFAMRAQLTDFILPLKLTTEAGARIRPTNTNIDELDAEVSTWRSTSGTPTRYAWYGYYLAILYPQPTSDTTLNITYVASPPLLAADFEFPVIPDDCHPHLVDFAIWYLRLKEGGEELANATESYLKPFLAAAEKYAAYWKAKSKGQLYDRLPHDLTTFDRSRLKVVLKREHVQDRFKGKDEKGM